MQRVILHCDMNNFYASVECMLNPELKNKPVAVCGSVEERHGIVLAKNYTNALLATSFSSSCLEDRKYRLPHRIVPIPSDHVKPIK